MNLKWNRRKKSTQHTKNWNKQGKKTTIIIKIYYNKKFFNTLLFSVSPYYSTLSSSLWYSDDDDDDDDVTRTNDLFHTVALFRVAFLVRMCSANENKFLEYSASWCFCVVGASEWKSLARSHSSHTCSFIFRQMSFHMQCQMIGTCKTALTNDAFEWFCAGVLAIMPGQFIRTSETPFTVRPLALIGLLSFKLENEKRNRKKTKHFIEREISVLTY